MTEKTSTIIPAGGQNLHLTGIAELTALGSALGVPKTVQGLKPQIILPPGYQALEAPRAELPPLPDHIRAAVTLNDSDSFIEYVKAFRTFTTRLFATTPDLEEIGPDSSGGAQFTAVLDYHEGGKEQKAARTAHTVVYPLPLSQQFSTWLGINGEPMSQNDFIEFIEANKLDVVSPDSASLMELAVNFESKTEVRFASKVDRVTGGRNLIFQEAIDAQSSSTRQGTIKVPDTMAIRVPILEEGKVFEIKCRLQWLPSNGNLRVVVHLQQYRDVFRHAFKEVRAEIEEALELKILSGESVNKNPF